MREIIYFFILIIAFSCSSSVLYSELTHDDGVSFYNEKKFSGLAIEKDKFDNIRVEKLYNEVIEYESINTLLLKNFLDIPNGFECFVEDDKNKLFKEI